MITLHAPRKDGDRWIARAELSWGPERLDLEVTASDAVYKQAAGWIADKAKDVWDAVSQWVTIVGPNGDPLTWGVFSALPGVATQVFEQLKPGGEVPSRDELGAVEHIYWPALFAGVMAGEPAALEAHRVVRLAEPARTALTMDAGAWPSPDDIGRAYYAQHAATRWAARDSNRRARFGCCGNSDDPTPVKPGAHYEFTRAMLAGSGIR